MTLSRFRAAPRMGHLDRIKRVFGYLVKKKHAVMRIRVEKPDFSAHPKAAYDWCNTCYAGAKEVLLHDFPKPMGKSVLTSHYVDANPLHNMISGRSVTGILHFLNKTVIDWYSKLQSTVETATHGSECAAARTCTEQIMDIRNTPQCLGVPVDPESYMFGDNESVVNSTMIPHSKLHKRHNALSCHRTREAVAAGFLRFEHVRSENNPADITSKHWSHASIWQQLRPILFWEGDTALIEAWDEWKKMDTEAKEAAERKRLESSKSASLKGNESSP